jgi:ATP synthase protein I
MADKTNPRDEDSDLRGRMEALRKQIDARTPAPPPQPKPGAASDSGAMGAQMSMGLRAGSEFVAAIVVGGAIGWGLDWLVHTKPLFTILFFLLGVVAGVLNVIRATSPNGGKFVGDSGLSGESAEDKDVPRESPKGREQ